MADISIKVVIEGRVQGIGFRWWIMEWANARSLDGWVRNRHEGTVEALFHGPEDSVRAMIQACEEGPPNARVRKVRQMEDDPPDEPGFTHRENV